MPSNEGPSAGSSLKPMPAAGEGAGRPVEAA